MCCMAACAASPQSTMTVTITLMGDGCVVCTVGAYDDPTYSSWL